MRRRYHRFTTENISAGGCGSGGRYYVHNGIGYKICVSAISHTSTHAEFENLKKLHEIVPGVFPKPYGVFYVYEDGRKKLALAMEHIAGKERGISRVLATKMRNAGIETADHSYSNCIETPEGVVRPIDADPRYVRILPSALAKAALKGVVS